MGMLLQLVPVPASLAAVAQPEQSLSCEQTPVGWPVTPQVAWQVPCGEQESAPVQPRVGEQGAHWWALQAWAGLPAPPQAAQSASAAQLAGHLGEHFAATQVSVVWHWVVLLAVQATHWWEVLSQTWWAGSQATQSASALQVMVGTPLFVGQVADGGAQLPELVHTWPEGQPVAPPAPQATQRF
jgi:hypothetical protein